MAAIEDVLREGKIRTRDRGGSSKTTEVGDVIAEKIRNLGC
jgi:isocitrate/isopropylmalate dehydrogenase